MSDKLEALSQLVAWIAIPHNASPVGPQAYFCTNESMANQWAYNGVEGANCTVSKLYSQEYVTALLQDISNLEQAMRHIHGAALDITVPRAAIAKAAEFATKKENRNG